MTALQTLKTGATALGVLLLMTAPFGAMYVYDKKFDSPEAREARRATRISQLRPTQPAAQAAATSPTVEVGCWAVASQSDGGNVELGATWHSPCPAPQNPTLPPGEYQLPTQTFYLSAWSAGTPDFERAQGRATLSPEAAEAEDTAGGLLFLPVTPDGRGYYLAAWTQLDAAGASQQGMQVGHYGAPPPSVSTAAGRIYLDAPRAKLPGSPGTLPEAEPDAAGAEQTEPDES